MKSAVALILLSTAAVSLARDWTVGARGKLMCGDQPLAGATVKLWDLDTWPDPDDLLQETTTDSQGNFEVKGTENEFTKITAVVKFYHRCNNKGIFSIPNICKRKITYEIPSSYIAGGQSVGKWYEMGVMNMEARQRNEDTECIGK